MNDVLSRLSNERVVEMPVTNDKECFMLELATFATPDMDPFDIYPNDEAVWIDLKKEDTNLTNEDRYSWFRARNDDECKRSSDLPGSKEKI